LISPGTGYNFFNEFATENGTYQWPIHLTMIPDLCNIHSMNIIRIHERGTLITIEGQVFKPAESKMFRIWGARYNQHVVALKLSWLMNLVPYSIITMGTNYDCWKEDEVPVSWRMLLLFLTIMSAVFEVTDGGHLKLNK
jgi:5'-methylthioadenosine phosphorylase